jgi:hypothetical protein
MATLNEIAYNIKNIAEGGVSPDDSNITLRQVKYMVHYHRANLLLQYTDNGRKTSESLYQVDKFTPLKNGIDINSLVGFNDNRAIRSVALRSTTNKDEDFDLLPLFKEHDKMFAQSSRFIKHGNKKFATIQENKLFIYEGSYLFDDSTFTVELNAIFSDPTKVSTYIDDDTTNYPIPQELISILTETILSKEFRVIMTSPSDTPNNQVDEKTERR